MLVILVWLLFFASYGLFIFFSLQILMVNFIQLPTVLVQLCLRNLWPGSGTMDTQKLAHDLLVTGASCKLSFHNS